mmetsp:Transcript_16967/g.46893  ORF Transcript_16967/g.46893 Transcript_16967/m.46893 type:complete len:241 (-) Transcript_16967:4162-4884(-)
MRARVVIHMGGLLLLLLQHVEGHHQQPHQHIHNGNGTWRRHTIRRNETVHTRMTGCLLLQMCGMGLQGACLCGEGMGGGSCICSGPCAGLASSSPLSGILPLWTHQGGLCTIHTSDPSCCAVSAAAHVGCCQQHCHIFFKGQISHGHSSRGHHQGLLSAGPHGRACGACGDDAPDAGAQQRVQQLSPLFRHTLDGVYSQGACRWPRAILAIAQQRPASCLGTIFMLWGISDYKSQWFGKN